MGFVATMGAVAYHLYLTLYEATVILVMASRPDAETLVGSDGALSHGAGALGPLAGLLLLAFPLLVVATLRAGVRRAWWAGFRLPACRRFLVLMLGIGAVNGGEVGPEATNWIGGMLPIASLYWVLVAAYARGGRAVRTTVAPQAATVELAIGILHRS